MLGALHAAGAGRAFDHNLKRRRMESVDMSQSSISHMISANQRLVASNEWGESRRASNFTARLHAAKFIKCDPLFKELFFPTLTSKYNFGFTSVSCTTAPYVATDFDGTSNLQVPPNADDWAKARAPFRGIVAFTLRSNRVDDPMSKTRKLSAIAGDVGKTLIGSAVGSITSMTDLYSSYRRFMNGPDGDGTGMNPQFNTNCPDVIAYSKTAGSAKLTNLECGFRADLESKAVQSSNFQHSIGSSTSSEGTTTSVAVTTGDGTNWDGSGRVLTTSGTDRKYFGNLRDTTMRISDGYLMLDITNGKTCSCLIELVIHSYKKGEVMASEGVTDLSNTKALYNAIWQAVQFQQRDVRINTVETTTGSYAPGGWQSLWDPKYPLLGVKSAHKKAAANIASEVHRSSHCLSPGQSKTIKIYLGGLYYKLGSTNEGQFDDSNNSSPYATSFACGAMPAGALQVTIGHSGFDQLVAPTSNGADFLNDPDYQESGSLARAIPGAGFWVGKQPAASEIVASGQYTEKFYPAYVTSSEREMIAGQLTNPWVERLDQDANYYRAGLPAARPVTDVVGTVNAENGGVPANNTDPARMEL